jgi:hypothetical protein
LHSQPRQYDEKVKKFFTVAKIGLQMSGQEKDIQQGLYPVESSIMTAVQKQSEAPAHIVVKLYWQ